MKMSLGFRSKLNTLICMTGHVGGNYFKNSGDNCQLKTLITKSKIVFEVVLSYMVAYRLDLSMLVSSSIRK